MAFLIKQKAAAIAMSRTASAASGASQAMVKFSKNLSKINRASWEAGRDMFGSIAQIDFDKAAGFMQSFKDMFAQMGILGKISAPFMRLLSMFDAFMIEEYTEDIVALNEALSNEDVREALRTMAQYTRVIGEAQNDLKMGLKMLNLVIWAFQELFKVMNIIPGSIETATMTLNAFMDAIDILNDKIRELIETTGGGGRGRDRGSSRGIGERIKDYIEEEME